MEHQNPDKQGSPSEAKRVRRNQSKYDKDTPRYECFCSKQYLSYPALYLHVKNKHNQSFQNPKNGKKIQMTKLIETLDAKQGFKVYKISMDSLGSKKQKEDDGVPNARYFQGQAFPDNPVYFQPSNFMNYGNIPYQFQYQFLGNKDQSSPHAKEAIIQIAFSRYFNSLNLQLAKEKVQIQLLLSLLINYINENYTILKEHGQQMEFRRYSAQQNCKYLSLFICQFIKKWIPEATQEQNKYYSFFVKHSSIISQGRYKKVLQQLLQFANGQRLQDLLEPEIIKPQQSISSQIKGRDS